MTTALASLSQLAHLEMSTASDDGPQLDPGCLPPGVTRLCCVPAPTPAPPEGEPEALLPPHAALPEQVLALPGLVYLDVSVRVPRRPRRRSPALGCSRPGPACSASLGYRAAAETSKL